MHPNPTASQLPHVDYRLLFLASVLLSALLIALDPLINRDAIIYLRSADAYMRDGFIASQQEYGRPLLPIGMALLHQLTGVSLVTAGLGLVTLFYALMCTTFVAVVHTLGGDRRVQLFAAILILFHPMLNQDRSSIMRDPAYWALLLMSFQAFLLYIRNPCWRYQWSWVILTLFAAAFRFEGLFFAVFAPFSLLFMRDRATRIVDFLRLLLPQLMAIGLVILWLVSLNGDSGSTPLSFPAIKGYINKLLQFPQQFDQLANRAGEAMLRLTARSDAHVAVFAGLSAILLLNICRALTWPWTLGLIWGWKHKSLSRFRPADSIALRAHLLIGFTYLAMFTLINQFMLERYSNQLVIFLLLYLPFLLNSLWQTANGHRKKLLVAFVLLAMAIDSLHTGESKKAFIRDAAEWVQEETPPASTLATNDKYIAYFGEREVDWKAAWQRDFKMRNILAEPDLWHDKDYLVMYVRKRDATYWSAFLQANKLHEIKAFPGSSGARVSVVRLRP